jgi:hypothetical protein
MNTEFWLQSQKGRSHSKDLDVDGDNIRKILKERVWKNVTGCICHRIGTRGGLLGAR